MERHSELSIKNSPNGSPIGMTEIVIGLGAVLVAIFAARFTVFIVGVVLAARGALDLFNALRIKGKKKPVGTIFVAILSLVTGILVLAWPVIGASVLSFVLAALFIVGGGEKIVTPFIERRNIERTTVVTGLISVLLGIVIVTYWRINSFTILGILVGIEIMLNGMTVTIAGRALYKLGRDIRPAP